MGPDRQHFVDRTSRQHWKITINWRFLISFPLLLAFDQRLHSIFGLPDQLFQKLVIYCLYSLWIEQTIWLKEKGIHPFSFPKVPFASDIEFLIEPMRSYIEKKKLQGGAEN